MSHIAPGLQGKWQRAYLSLAVGSLVGKMILVWIKLESKVRFILKRYSLVRSKSGPWGFRARSCQGSANSCRVRTQEASPPHGLSAGLTTQLSSPPRLFSWNDSEKP